MRRRGLFSASAVIASMALALSACGSSENSDDEEQADEKTTLSVGWNQPFYSYNSATSNGNATANAVILYMMNGGFVYYDAEAQLQQDETFGTYEKISDDPLTVKYTVGDDTTWSDGTPVDAVDMLLDWAAHSGNVNTIEADKVKRDEATGLPQNTEGQVYFDSSSPGLALVTETPTLSDDNKSITLVFDEPYADWEITEITTPDVPAHIVASRALEIDDPQEAKDEIVRAIQEEDAAALEPVSAFWNTGFDYTSFPEDEGLRLSNGAYIMTAMEENEFVTLTKNEDYSGAFEPNIDEITVRWNEDGMAQLQALQNGEISLFSPQVTEDIIVGAEEAGLDIAAGVEGTYEHVDLVLNNKGPFDPAAYGGDAETANLVRRAFLHAIPRQEVIDKLITPVQDGAEVRNSFLITAGAPGYDEIVAANGSDVYAERDVEESKRLLEEAGVTGPIDVRMMYAKDNPRRESEFEIYKPALAEAGFNLINARNVDWGSKLGDGTYDAVFFGWQSTSTGVSSDQGIYGTGGINNLIGYSNPDVDELFSQLVVTTDPAEQLDLQTQIEQILFEDAIGITVFQFPGASIWDGDTLTGVDPGILSPTMFHGFWNWEVVS